MALVSLPFDAFCITVFALWFVKTFGRKPPGPLPPGPTRLPLLGNVFDMPSEKQWVTFTEWGRKWGDVVSVSILGQEIIILNSLKVAVEMLDKKSAKYSDRPILQMAGELMGWKNALGLHPYGERFRKYRKRFHQLIGSHSAISRFDPVEEAETRRFLQLTLHNPENLAEHIRRTIGAIILRLTYGYTVQEHDDPFVALADAGLEQFSIAVTPGAYLVDIFPALRCIPKWFPGAGFKRQAASWAKTLSDMTELPFEFVKTEMATGNAENSFTSNLLSESEGNPEEEDVIKWSALSIYAGGADTTVAAIHSFFLAMVLFPDVVKKAQLEIDTAIGDGSLPRLEDRSRLPYVNALVLEVCRWHAVAPTGLPHRVTEEDTHDGFLIPQGAIVFVNIWHLLHDPAVYADPMTFRPERFLGPNAEPDPREICFGFGRRICPGRYLTDSSIFISCAMALAVFDITKATENGAAVELVVDQTSGTISHPRPFKFSIQPRSEKAVSMINLAE